MNSVLDCLIVGAGFGGIGMAITLLKSGIKDIVLLEKSPSAGGCWLQNRYPGAACDVPSHLYSYSFEPHADWSRKFAPQAEIQAYIERCAQRYGVFSLCRFGRCVAAAVYDETHCLWEVRTVDGELFKARTLVAGTGQLSKPAYPAIAGRETFAGQQFHSADWPAGLSLQGKRVGVIGSGASAIQFIPELAKTVAELVIFQRSAPYILDKPDRAYSQQEKSRFKARPLLLKLSRILQYWQHEARFFAFDGYPLITALYTRKCLAKLAREVKDPVIRAKLTPDYPLGCKRILISNNFYPVFNLSNVHLETDEIGNMNADGIVLTDGRHIPLDVVVYGTGFRSTEFVAPMEVKGLQGKTLQSVWKEGAEAYLGISVSGFPNFFMLYGPNTNLGHNSILAMLENQFFFIDRCIVRVLKEGTASLDVLPSAQFVFNVKLQRHLHKTVWGGGCHSWYKTDSGKITNNWYGFVTTYRYLTHYPDFSSYQEVKK